MVELFHKGSGYQQEAQKLFLSFTPWTHHLSPAHILTWFVQSLSFNLQVRHHDFVEKFNWFFLIIVVFWVNTLRLCKHLNDSGNSTCGRLLLVLPSQISWIGRNCPLRVMAEVAVIMRLSLAPPSRTLLQPIYNHRIRNITFTAQKSEVFH